MNLKKYFAGLAAALLLSAAGTAAAEHLTSGEGLPENCRELEASVAKSGPLLLFSDSPEMVYQKGILYRDVVEGDVRIFFHHVNAMDSNKKIAVILKNNQGLRPSEYTVKKKGLGTPSWNYMYAGKTSQQEYFSDVQQTESGTLGFSRSKELLTGYGMLLEPGKLLVGTIDLHLSRPVEISVVMCDLKNDLELFNSDAPVLPMDEHPLRGSFRNADWQYKVKAPIAVSKDTPAMLELAASCQGFAKGKDATTNLEAENYGNYGVMYDVSFEIGGTEKVKMLLNPLGGLFAGYGVLEHNGSRQLVALPGESLSIGDSYDDMLEVATLEPGKYNFIWSPPGASNLPVRLYWQSAAL